MHILYSLLYYSNRNARVSEISKHCKHLKYTLKEYYSASHIE